MLCAVGVVADNHRSPGAPVLCGQVAHRLQPGFY